MKLASLGGIEAILSAMSAHKSSAAVQCGALWNISVNGSNKVCLTALPDSMFYCPVYVSDVTVLHHVHDFACVECLKFLYID